MRYAERVKQFFHASLYYHVSVEEISQQFRFHFLCGNLFTDVIAERLQALLSSVYLSGSLPDNLDKRVKTAFTLRWDGHQSNLILSFVIKLSSLATRNVHYRALQQRGALMHVSISPGVLPPGIRKPAVVFTTHFQLLSSARDDTKKDNPRKSEDCFRKNKKQQIFNNCYLLVDFKWPTSTPS